MATPLKTLKCIGGPLDGEEFESRATEMRFSQYPNMEYRRTDEGFVWRSVEWSPAFTENMNKKTIAKN